jgi:glucarate dehydratase
MKISRMTVTRVASPDFALLNSTAVHPTHFERAIVEMETADGFRGAGEVPGSVYEALIAARPFVLGHDPLEIEYFRQTIRSVAAFGAIEVACLDIIGKVINRRVVDLIGGPFREAAPYSAYIFYVMPTSDGPSYVKPEDILRQYREFRNKYGFKAVKFKGGVFPPDQEIEALRLIRAEFSDAPLRIDPNQAWSVETSVRVAKALEPLEMEYLEDPTEGLDGMAAVRKQVRQKLATNMVVTQMGHIAPAFQKGSIDIVLLDNHYMGGLHNCRYWAAICQALGWGCSGHSNNHLGISMAAMTHMNCAIAHATYHADTHYPWTTLDVIKGPMLTFQDGKMPLPEGPGLGVEIDPDKLAQLAANVDRIRSRVPEQRKWNSATLWDRRTGKPKF